MTSAHFFYVYIGVVDAAQNATRKAALSDDRIPVATLIEPAVETADNYSCL